MVKWYILLNNNFLNIRAFKQNYLQLETEGVSDLFLDGFTKPGNKNEITDKNEITGLKTCKRFPKPHLWPHPLQFFNLQEYYDNASCSNAMPRILQQWVRVCRQKYKNEQKNNLSIYIYIYKEGFFSLLPHLRQIPCH